MRGKPDTRTPVRGTWLVVLIVLALVAAACASEGGTNTTAGDDGGQVTTTNAPDDDNGEDPAGDGATVTAPEIPDATVEFAMYPCCVDNNVMTIGIEKGWFDDLGITIEPEGGHLFTLFDQVVPSMQRGDFDVSAIFIQGYLQTLDSFGMDVPPIWFNDIYVGYAIMRAPGSDYKTTEEFMDEGMSIGEAITAAVEQLDGAEVYTPPHGQVQPPYPDVFMSYADLSYPDDLNLQFLEDQNIMAVATQEGRIDLAIPYAAPVVVQMLNEGWEPIVNTEQVLSDVGSPQAERMTTLVGSSGLFAQREWVENNRETALRFVSVGFRALDMLNDPETQHEAWTIQVDQINSTQGLDLAPEDAGVIWESIDPAFPFEEQGPELWDDPDAPFYVPGALETQIQSLIDNGTLTGPLDAYDLDEFLVARDLYEELVALQSEADDLFAQTETMELSASQQDVVEQARSHYDGYNFLDAVRFLEAALDG